MVYNILDKSGRYIGSTILTPSSSMLYTTEPVKPLKEEEVAIYKNGKWNYEFQDEPISTCEHKNYLKFSNIYHSNICPISGDLITEKSNSISVLIPCYGKAKYIIETVQSCINQTMALEEIVILLMDEASIAMKEEIETLSSNIRCVIHDRMNASLARTYLVNNLCETEWFIFLDADDRLKENAVEELYKSNASVSFLIPQLTEEDGTFYRDIDILQCTPYCHGKPFAAIYGNLTALMSKTIFNEIGLDEDLCCGGEDYDFILRLFSQKKYKIETIFTSCYFYRNSQNGLSKRPEFYDSHNRAVIKNLEFLHSEFLLDMGENKFEEDFYNNPTMETILKYIDLKTTLKNLLVSDTFSMLREKLKESKERTPLEAYSPDKFTAIGGLDMNYFDFTGRTFDVIFLGGLLRENVFTNKIACVINNKIFAEVAEKGLLGHDMVNYLLNHYACFETNDGDHQTLSEEEAYEIIKNSDTDASIKEIVNLIETVEFKPSEEGYEKQRVSFILHKNCNLRCSYCNSNCYNNILTDDEIYNNFDNALSIIEKKSKQRIIPQLLGGEPTLWSDYLVNKLLNRLKDYRDCTVFSNGTNKESLWYKAENFKVITHIIDWKEALDKDKIDRSDFGLRTNEIPIIVVTHQDMEDIEKVMSKFEYFDYSGIQLTPCVDSPNPEQDLTEEDIYTLGTLYEKYNLTPPCYCNSNKAVSIDCNTNTFVVCCKCNDKYDISLYDTNLEPDCSNCIFRSTK